MRGRIRNINPVMTEMDVRLVGAERVGGCNGGFATKAAGGAGAGLHVDAGACWGVIVMAPLPFSVRWILSVRVVHLVRIRGRGKDGGIKMGNTVIRSVSVRAGVAA